MFRDLYKQSVKSSVYLQEERRLKLLEEQKRKRLLQQDLQRNVDSTDNRHTLKLHSHGGKGVSSKLLKDAYGSDYTLQLSEWMRERPENLCDWVLVPCPKGQRCLLMASSGRTEMYSKSGRRYISFHTFLPGDFGFRGCTLLDCIYSPDLDTFYVLDALIYGDQELVHCEAQFRFFWLRSKFDECEALSKRSRFNEKPLKLLDRYDFEKMECVLEAFQRFPIWPKNKPNLDGWLFYHKESSYTCGSTPLVGWLFAFMVPDVLKMPVNENYKKPANYSEPIAYMDEFDAKLAQKKHKRIRKPSNSTDMDTLDNIDNCEDEEKFVETDNVSLNDVFEAERILENVEPDSQFLTCDVQLDD